MISFLIANNSTLTNLIFDHIINFFYFQNIPLLKVVHYNKLSILKQNDQNLIFF